MNLHIFNNWHDMALAHGNAHYQPPVSARKMADDLAALAAWNAQEGDAVLVDDIATVCQWHAPLPHPKVKWVSWRAPYPMPDKIVPWGWDETMWQMLYRWAGSPSEDAAFPEVEQLNQIRRLSSRVTAVDVLKQLTDNDRRYLGQSYHCTTEESIKRVVESYPRTYLKTLWSSSGKGLRQGNGEYSELLGNWCRRALLAQGGVVVEPRYERKIDFALEFFSEGGGKVRFEGYSLFETNDNGAYRGNLLADDALLEQQIVTACKLTMPNGVAMLHDLQRQLCRIFSSSIASCYKGPFGVDMMVAREKEGDDWQIHPCVEINLRYNMGWWAHTFVQRYMPRGVVGKLLIDFSPTAGTMQNCHLQQEAAFPCLTENGRMLKGYCALHPINRRTQYRASVWID